MRRRLADLTPSLRVSFAGDGDPNGPARPERPFAGPSPTVLILDGRPSVSPVQHVDLLTKLAGR